MNVHPLDPETVRETNAWFYRSHPRGRELRGAPLHPTSAEDAEGRHAWVAEYRRRLAETQTGSGHQPSPGGGTDPLDSCQGCCPTDFGVFVHGTLAPQQVVTLETEESVVLRADDMQPAGFGAGTYTWTTTSRRLSLGESSTSSRVAKGTKVTIHAGTEPTGAPERGELVEVTRTQPHCAPLTRQMRILIKKCKLFRLAQPKIILIATDKILKPTTTVVDPKLPGGYSLGFGQDLSFSKGAQARTQPHGPSVGMTTASLESKMRRLLSIFARNDPPGKAQRLFDAFLAPQSAVLFWSDKDLNAAADVHPHIKSFISLALNAPNSPERTPGKRIHQALESAGWDINAAVPAAGGVPAFNVGKKEWQTGDFGNGLGVMINSIQHAIVIAKEYYYDRCNGEYYIKLEYVFYDVFGLDDDDLMEFGADGGIIDSNASQGITAWWQLQHQHGYAPLITRIAIERQFRVPVPPTRATGGASP
jgi:hypothetical protein